MMSMLSLFTVSANHESRVRTNVRLIYTLCIYRYIQIQYAIFNKSYYEMKYK